ncbi:DNA primase [Corynebacterium liangguodongii]|uniref:DNA primase n=1 Tax=Corynebacterium liangguodongii TaxID=2079535 RepID=A0A2S0WDF3_9CORY|nr:DNA primase [Corynebacterium liangguodongii]AWB83805.1 DNA primase [Corynebacterium liangguodongii]PWB98926.1 DNA primase [Corynebacterium liangguodongii]
MSFFEDIAAALDRDGIESRVHDETMFVPITADVEIQFVEIDPHLPAANVYIAAADVDEDDEEFEAVLVSVVFSVEDAVNTVSEHVATDQVVTVLRDLHEATDERISDLEFFPDPVNTQLMRAEVGQSAELQVLVEVVDGEPCASVTFVALAESYDDLVDDAIGELWESDGDAELTDEDRARLFETIHAEAVAEAEVLDLGRFADFDRLFDVLSLAADQAEEWEAQLLPVEDGFDEPEVYDIFGRDGLDDELEGLDDVDDDDEEGFDDDFDFDDEDEDNPAAGIDPESQVPLNDEV